MDINKVFTDFCEELKKRTGFTSEDTIRYYWFASMLKQDLELNHYQLEAPYNLTKEEMEKSKLKVVGAYTRQELDLLYSDEISEEIGMEIKFHRNPSKTSYAKPDAAGAILGDILRLCEFKRFATANSKRLFLYVTDSEMDDYLKQRSGRPASFRPMLKDLYNLDKSSPMPYYMLDTEDITFYRSTYKSFKETPKQLLCPKIRLIDKYDEETENNTFAESKIDGKRMLHVRLYEISPTHGTTDFVDKLNVGIKSVIESWFVKYGVSNVKPIIVKNEDGKFSHIAVEGNVVIENFQEAKLPYYIIFGKVNGNFKLLNCHQLSSVAGFPIEVTGDFICNGCEQLTEDEIRYIEKERVWNMVTVDSKDQKSTKGWLKYFQSGRAEERPLRKIGGKIIIN